jgi:hypothetical protein
VGSLLRTGNVMTLCDPPQPRERPHSVTVRTLGTTHRLSPWNLLPQAKTAWNPGAQAGCTESTPHKALLSMEPRALQPLPSRALSPGPQELLARAKASTRCHPRQRLRVKKTTITHPRIRSQRQLGWHLTSSEPRVLPAPGKPQTRDLGLRPGSRLTAQLCLSSHTKS